MTLARRLLGSAGGTGAFTPPLGYVAAGNLVASGSPVTIDAGTGYKAFPGLCLTPAGRLLLVYRHGSTHVTPDDGYIAGRYSDNNGATWGAAFTIYAPDDDARDPSLTTLSDGRIALSLFRYASGLAYQCEVLFSDDDGANWSAPVVVSKTYIVESHTYDEAACSAPVVEVSPSLLLLPVYMHDGVLNWNAFVVPSTDGGDTFTAPILVATGGSKSWTEPWVMRLPDGTLYCTIRVDNLTDAYSSTSGDDGDTWSAAAYEWDSGSRSAMIRTAHGALFTTGRNAGAQGQYSTSWDEGATWEARASLPSPSTAYMYGAIAQATDGTVVLVWSQEVSASDADLYCQRYLDSGP